MNKEKLKTLLEKLIATWENAVVEFKEVNDGYSFKEIGKYFSALANEANLRDIEIAWLVFGVNNKNRKITTTDFYKGKILEGIKVHISNGTEPNITFRNIYEYFTENNGRVILFEIPAAPRGIPISWNG